MTERNPTNGTKNRQPASPNPFEGKCAKIKSHIYDVSPIPNNHELFSATTEAIDDFVAKEYEYAGKYRRGLPDLNLPTLTAPTNPNPLAMVSVKLGKLDLKDHCNKLRQCDMLSLGFYPWSMFLKRPRPP